MTGATKLAFALDGLIRARTKGHGGEEYARKCINEIAEGIEELTTPNPTPTAHTSAMKRVLVPVDGQWQTGDVVKQSAFGVWFYMTLDRGGWRDSTPSEVAAYEAA